jgi:hypothetical protein
MLDEAFLDIVGLAAVKASGGLALEDVDPIRHNKKGRRTGHDFCGSSGRTRTYNLVVNSHPLCRLSYRGILTIEL